jgi:serine/threonine-protein kinase
MSKTTEPAAKMLRRPAPLVVAGSPRPGLPLDIQEEAVGRLRALLLVAFALSVVYLVYAGLVAPNLDGEAGRILAPTRLAGRADDIAMGLLGALALLELSLYILARTRWLQPASMLRVGLAYELIVALVIATSNLLVFQHAVREGRTWPDVSLTLTGVWVLLYPMIVPTRAWLALLVSLLAVSFEPLMFGEHLRGEGVDISAVRLAWAFRDNIVCAVLAVIPAHVVHQLGHKIGHERELGRYRLEERIGAGGMGEVWRAAHRLLARPVAIKIIRSETLNEAEPHSAAGILARFEREARVTASLQSPHSIEIFDYGLAEDGTFYLVMELLDGFDLASLVERFGPQPSERVAYLMGQACHSLHDAHEMGLVHRDVKPANIFTCRKGQEHDFVKVLDFGLVKPLASARNEEISINADESVTGTPAFMAPEQASAPANVDARTDVYGLACVGYWLLTGHLVFEGATAVDVLVQHLRDDPVPPSSRTERPVDPALEAVLMACLRKDPRERPASARELGERIFATGLAVGWTEGRARDWWAQHDPRGIPEQTPPTRDDVPTPDCFRRRAARRQTSNRTDAKG